MMTPNTGHNKRTIRSDHCVPTAYCSLLLLLFATVGVVCTFCINAITKLHRHHRFTSVFPSVHGLDCFLTRLFYTCHILHGEKTAIILQFFNKKLKTELLPGCLLIDNTRLLLPHVAFLSYCFTTLKFL